MPDGNGALDRVDPIAEFRFAVIIDGITQALFTECSGLSAERKVEPKPQGGVNDHVHQLPGRLEYPRLTLKRGIADDKLWNWFFTGLYDCKIERRDIEIILYNSDLTVLQRWNLAQAFPVKWTGPNFRSDSNQAAVETLELVHHGLSVSS
ncbi:MAG: phage tail protein [Chloroflexota bacterium]